MSAPPPAVHRILITVEQAAMMVSARREAVRQELERLGLIRITPFGPRVPVDALRAWALGLPPTNDPPPPLPSLAPTQGLRIVYGGTLDKPTRKK